jgi:ribosome-binding ATPase YchF (GTP1/OBG family)
LSKRVVTFAQARDTLYDFYKKTRDKEALNVYNWLGGMIKVPASSPNEEGWSEKGARWISENVFATDKRVVYSANSEMPQSVKNRVYQVLLKKVSDAPTAEAKAKVEKAVTGAVSLGGRDPLQKWQDVFGYVTGKLAPLLVVGGILYIAGPALRNIGKRG